MKLRILNGWNSTEGDLRYYDCTSNQIVYELGDYLIVKLFYKAYLYVYKDIAFSCLAGLNKEHLEAVANREKPENSFLYERAIAALEKGENLKSGI